VWRPSERPSLSANQAAEPQFVASGNERNSDKPSLRLAGAERSSAFVGLGSYILQLSGGKMASADRHEHASIPP
jgi:hypothetical protein